MSDKQYYLITVSFGDYGVRYLIKIFNNEIVIPDWKENDKRWFSYDENDIIVKIFKAKFEKKIARTFDGQILILEPYEVVVL